MNALYPLGGKQDFGYVELLFSLRTLDKFGIGIKKVFVIGDSPGFLNPKTTKRFDFEEHGVKDFRIAKKIEFACGTNISDDFLFCNDDHFFTREFDATKFPYYHKGDLKVEHPKAKYENYLNTTFDFLESINKPTNHFDVHCPIIYNKDKFLELSEIWNPQISYVVKSTYANYHNIEGQEYTDHKLKHLVGEKQLERAFENECFSVYDCCVERGLLNYMCTNFSEPSKFEKENIRFALEPRKSFNDIKEKCLRRKKEIFEVDNDRAMEILTKAPELVKIISIG